MIIKKTLRKTFIWNKCFERGLQLIKNYKVFIPTTIYIVKHQNTFF